MGGEAAPGTWGGWAAAFLAATAAAFVACLRVRGDRPRLFVCLAMLFFAGSGAYLARTPKAELPPDGGGTLVLKGRCERVFAPPDRYVVRSGDLRLLLRTDDSVEPGDSVVFEARVWPLAEKRRSHDFDYDRYLRHQGVQAKTYPRSVVRVTGHSDDAFTYCHALRERLVDKLERVVPDTLTRSMVEALCLGYLADIRPDTEELFRTTGTIHLLSVSGLHMGIIYVFFSFLFKLVGIRSPKSRLALIPLLWFFACLSGLSSPACRAAVILSVLLVGEAFRKDYVPLNAVAASAPDNPTDAVRVHHLEQPVLDIAAKTSATRPLGDGAWAWDRNKSPEDAAPLMAATLAFGLATSNQEKKESAYEAHGLMIL